MRMQAPPVGRAVVAERAADPENSHGPQRLGVRRQRDMFADVSNFHFMNSIPSLLTLCECALCCWAAGMPSGRR
jgi:hypothetical protein